MPDLSPERVAELERLREMVMLRVPDGFRDDDGVWHDGPHRITALADLDALAALLAERKRLRAENERLREALRRYGHHRNDCRAHGWEHTEKEAPLCDCGFFAALAAPTEGDTDA